MRTSLHAPGAGSAYRYDYGCRCSECRGAKTLKRRLARDRARAVNSPSYQRELAAGRALKERYRGTCSNCGRRTTGGDGAAAAPELCSHCAPAVYGEKRRGTGSHAAAIRLALADGPLRTKEVARRSGLDYNNTNADLYRLLRYGIVEKVARGTWQLAEREAAAA